MPIFHFSVRDRSNITDPDRTELANLRDEFWERSEWRVEVTDGAGLILFRFDFTATDAASIGERPTL